MAGQGHFQLTSAGLGVLGVGARLRHALHGNEGHNEKIAGKIHEALVHPGKAAAATRRRVLGSA